MKLHIPSRNTGFTLIELMVVIAIIGILATIVLSALGDSKTKAYDSQVKQQLSRFRSAAEIYSSNQTPAGYAPVSVSYSTCSDGMFADVTEGDGAPGLYILPANLPGVTASCAANQFAYAVWAPLPSGGSYFCVDSKGAAEIKPNPAPGGPVTVCP